MKKILFIFIILGSINLNAQNDKKYLETLVEEFTQNLENRNIKNYFYTTRYCSGNIVMFKLDNGKRCMSKETYYEVFIFWKEKEGVSMMKKIDNCGLYFSVPLPENDVVSFYLSNLEKLRSKVKNYKTAEKTIAPIQRTEIHNCYREFKFIYGNEKFEQLYNEFALINDSQNANINFDYNNSLVVVSLDKIIDTIIEQTAKNLRRLP